MAIYKEGKEISAIYYGQKVITAVYKGGRLVWEALRSNFLSHDLFCIRSKDGFIFNAKE